jgi:hypothetical protein
LGRPLRRTGSSGSGWFGLWATIAVGLALFAALGLRAGSVDGFRYYLSIRAGDRYATPGQLLPGQHPVHGNGYDGQFYFFIAQDPFLRNPVTAHSLDNSQRFRRILYPLLAGLLSLGNRSLLPYLLVLVNVLASAATVAACAVAARRAGRPPVLALVVAIFPGLWIPILYDLTEPLQLALVAWGMLLEIPLLLFLSALAKETTAVVQLTEMIRNAAARRWGRALQNGFLLGLVVTWSLFVLRVVRARESNLQGHLLDPPGAPLLELVHAASTPGRYAFLLPPILICALAILRFAWTRDRYAAGAALYGLVGLAAGSDTWIDPLGYYRVIAVAAVLAFMSWTVAGDRLGAAVVILMAFAGGIGLASAVGA